jgi:hypothetical protein
VKLINTDGMAFIGPGSEWFWTALSGIILAITFLGIYRQLSIARSANAFEQLNRIENEWASERATRHTLDIYLALREGVNPEQVPYGAASFVADFWESVALLVRAGHVDRRLVYEYMGNSVRWWWAALAPWTRRSRIERGDPKNGEHHEWLAGLMAEMDGKAGVGPLYDEAYLASTLGRRIENEQGRLRIAEELRAVIVRPMSPGVTTEPPSVAQVETAPAGQPVTRGT